MSRTVTGAWTDFLHECEPSDHAVQVYEDVEELADSVGAYLVAGFEAGEPAIVIATPDHVDVFTGRLDALGWGAERRAGLFETADAEVLLAELTDSGMPSPAKFFSVVGAVVDDAIPRSATGRVRAFGELVDVLCRRGEARAAAVLEELWNDLLSRRSFSLLCGYQLDLFDRNAQSATLPGVCKAHTHVLPAVDSDRLAHAVDSALRDVLGGDADKVYVVVEPEARRGQVPRPQLALMWVSRNMPLIADRVLAAARSNYSGTPTPA